ncbi:MAG: hypothetical protein E7167_05400 [Firmicutes bacterium]|nr:hypothetical protein [Bacillota bacterium]
MIDNLYQDSLSFKDKILSIVCYIWLVPLVILFIPKKGRFIKRNLIIGIILSIIITGWIITILVVVRKNCDLQLLNVINCIVFAFLIIFQIIQIIRIIRRKSY